VGLFEADLHEKAKAGASEAVALALLGENTGLVVGEVYVSPPAHLVMWDKAEITAMIIPGLMRLDAAVKLNELVSRARPP
jgi:hypothetical protein